MGLNPKQLWSVSTEGAQCQGCGGYVRGCSRIIVVAVLAQFLVEEDDAFFSGFGFCAAHLYHVFGVLADFLGVLQPDFA